jgi:aminocarboxymuconate-semialdehyde decarboxylase
VPIDVHAHYVPPQLIAAVKARGADIGARLAGPPGGEALQFDHGFRLRPFFARLIEPAAARKAWLAEKRIDRQVVGTWPDMFAYGLPPPACQAWHRLLNDTLGEWCAEHAAQFSWIASVPMPGGRPPPMWRASISARSRSTRSGRRRRRSTFPSSSIPS